MCIRCRKIRMADEVRKYLRKLYPEWEGQGLNHPLRKAAQRHISHMFESVPKSRPVILTDKDRKLVREAIIGIEEEYEGR